MGGNKSAEEIADMVSDSVSCEQCRLKKKCDGIYVGEKAMSNCCCMWLDWIQGKID